MLVATDAFVALAEAHARTLTDRDVPTLAIEHPLGGIDSATVRARADTALPALLDLLEQRA